MLFRVSESLNHELRLGSIRDTYVWPRHRHLAVDTDGSPSVVQVHAANVQDRDGAVPLLPAVQARQASVCTVFADGAQAWLRPAAIRVLMQWPGRSQVTPTS